MTKNTGNRGGGKQGVKDSSKNVSKSDNPTRKTFVGYSRISTSQGSQKLDSQLDELKAYGVEKIFTDQISGATSVRPGYTEMLSYIRPGDTIVVVRLDRLARSLRDLLNKVEYFKDNNIGLISLSESIDTTTDTGKLILSVFGAIAEFERSLIRSRSKAGIEAYRFRHERWGRPSKLSQNQQQTMLKLYRESRNPETPKEERKTVKELIELFNISRSAFYEYVRKNGDSRSVGKMESNGVEVTEAKKKKVTPRKPSKGMLKKSETTPKKPMEELYPGVDNESKELF